MKIKMINRPYEEVMALPRPEHRKPHKPDILFRTLVRVASMPDLWATRFTYDRDRTKDEGGPYLVLMNHSSFLDLEIAFRILYPKPFCTVCTTDAMVGKARLMRMIGCIPTQKFVTDLSLIRDIKYAIHEKGASVLMYPEAGYSFDGRATTLPENAGGLLKLVDAPVLTITTHGAFARDPLYNGLQKRKVRVSADVKCILSREEIREKSVEELNGILQDVFSFDNFAWQYQQKLAIKEDFRADGLERVLYKCAACGAEGRMEGKGTTLTCHACGKSYHMDELGRLNATEGETEFPHIPDWYTWERSSVRAELEAGAYRMDVPVKIALMVDEKALYMVGDGRLHHDADGFHLTGCDGRLDYRQKPRVSHSLNADFFWYEIGDVIGIGNRDCLYYCFPQAEAGNPCPVAKARLAAEELYKLAMAGQRHPKTKE